MGAATSAGIEPTITDEPLRVTLLELVEAISDVTNSDAEVVATVIHMIETGRVRLSGSFRDSRSAPSAAGRRPDGNLPPSRAPALR